MAQTLAATVSEPGSRISTPPPPPARPIPTDFRASLAAWWSNSSYREARVAEERLLRRLAHYTPPPPQMAGSWLPWSGGSSAGAAAVTAKSSELRQTPSRAEDVVPPAATESGLVATLRNVFISTPDPSLAPADPTDVFAPSASSDSVASSASHSKVPRLHRKKVAADKLVDYINTLEISRPANAGSREAVVVLHGYAAALGFFFRNWDAWAAAGADSGRRTFFLDWLGMGLSSRPSPALLAAPPTAPLTTRVARAEHFFLSSLEAWRKEVGVEKMVLVGHSLGGYLASAYAVRYPDRVSSLILVSPAGIPEGPKDWTPSGPGARTGPGGKRWKDGKPVEDDVPAASGTQERQGLDEAVDAAEAEFDGGGAKGEAKDWRNNREVSFLRRNATKAFVWGWEKGLSPFSILRTIGPWGPMLVGRYSSRRFAAQSEEDVRDLHAYIYNTSIMKGSGEYCISHLLAPGAYARMPIIDRVHRLKIPVTFLYGDNDWMDVEGGRASARRLAKAGNDKAKVYVVPGAGHHLYLDNPDFTNKVVREAIVKAPQ
ncbi:hypothetical protein Q5752_000582 [Cryptotrichosporon argae]